MSKNRVIVEAVLAGQSHGSVARQYGISTVWVGKLAARWRAGGWDAVEKKSTRPRSNPNATGDDTGARIVALRHELTAAGLDAGPHTLARPPAAPWTSRPVGDDDLADPDPPRSGHCRAAEATQALLPAVRGGPAERVLAVRLHPLAPGRRHRRGDPDVPRRPLPLRLSCTAHAPVTGDIVVAAFRAAIDAHGIPASTLTDNGLVFTTRFLHGPNNFERELVILGIDQKNGRPNHPQTQGKVESFQQTLKKWQRAQPPARTLRHLQAQLDEFTDTYNHQRPHRSLAKRTHADVYAARSKAAPPAATDTGASATTRSPAAASPCATADDCTTSDSATSTTASPCGSSSTTCTSR